MITVEPAREADVQDVARVYVETWRTAYAGILSDVALTGMSERRSAEEWGWVIRQRRDVQPVIVAREAARVLGMVSVGLSRRRDRPTGGKFEASTLVSPVGEVFTLYVAPEAQERGIGRRLLAAGFDALTQRNCARAILWVLRDNPSRFFYERMGGQAIAERIETLWGRAIPERAYGWMDCAAAAQRLAACSVR